MKVATNASIYRFASPVAISETDSKVEIRTVNFSLIIQAQSWIVHVRTRAFLRRKSFPEGCIFLSFNFGASGESPLGAQGKRYMAVREVRTGAPPVLSVIVAFWMIIAGALSIGLPLALVIILICSATDGIRLSP